MSVRNAVLAVLAAAAAAAIAVVALRGGSGAPDLGDGHGPPTATGRAPGDPRAAAPDLRTPTDPTGAPDVDRTATSAAELRGRVIDARGFAVANAEVFVDDARSQRTDRPVATAITDGAGRYALTPAPPPGSPFWLHVRHPGHAPFAREHAELRDEPPDAGRSRELADAVLTDGGTILGVVTTTADVPVGDATITPYTALAVELRTARDRSDLVAPTQTRPDGTFRLGPLNPGRYRLEIGAPRMQLLRTAAIVHVTDGDEVDLGPIRLEGATELRGVVVDVDGEPLPGARIQLRAEQEASPGFRAEARCDEGGRFAIDHVPLATVEVVATLTGHVSWRGARDTRIPGEMWIRLEPGLALAGTVVDATSGQPVESFAARPVRLRDLPTAAERSLEESEWRAGSRPGAAVSIPAAPSGARARRVPRGLDEPGAFPGGTFRFAGLDEGVYAVDVRAPGFAYARSEPVELRAGGAAPPVAIALARGIRIAGVVVDAFSGDPVAGAAVELTLPANASGPEDPFDRVFATPRPDGVRLGATITSTSTGADGAFVFEDMLPRSYVVLARNSDWTDAVVGPLQATSDTDGVRVEMSRGAVLHGTVGNLGGAGRDTTRVVIYGGPGRLHLGDVAQDGSYEVSGLDPGPWVVRAFVGNPVRQLSQTPGLLQVQDRSELPADVVLRADERHRLDLTLEVLPVGDLVVEVTENGAPVEGARIWIPSTRTGRTDANGRFSIRALPTGPADVRISLPGTSGLHREKAVVAPDRESLHRVALTTGSLRARVTAADGFTGPLDGSATFLPGAIDEPANQAEYTRAGNPGFAARVENGRIDAAHLPAGAGLLVVQCGTARAAVRVVIPHGGTAEVEVAVRPDPSRR